MYRQFLCLVHLFTQLGAMSKHFNGKFFIGVYFATNRRTVLYINL